MVGQCMSICGIHSEGVAQTEALTGDCTVQRLYGTAIVIRMYRYTRLKLGLNSETWRSQEDNTAQSSLILQLPMWYVLNLCQCASLFKMDNMLQDRHFSNEREAHVRDAVNLDGQTGLPVPWWPLAF